MIKKVLIISSILIGLLVGGVAFDNYQLSKVVTETSNFKNGVNVVTNYKYMDGRVYVTVHVENAEINEYMHYWLTMLNPDYAGIDFIDKDKSVLDGVRFKYNEFIKDNGVLIANKNVSMDKKTYRKINKVIILIKGGGN